MTAATATGPEPPALVTGCAGMIGAQVATLLLQQGAPKVIGIDALNPGPDAPLKQWRLTQLSHCPRFHFHQADIADPGCIDALFAQYAPTPKTAPPFSAVINLAARAGVRQSAAQPDAYYRANLTGALNLLQASARTGVPKFVLASSSSVYGSAPPDAPIPENTESSRPLSPYAASKKAAEALTHAYHHLYGIDISVLRYFTVYGPAGRPDMSLFRFVQKIAEARPITVYGDGSQRRDFTYVDDVAQATILALKPLGYQIINIGAAAPIPLRDAIAAIEAAAGRKAAIHYRPPHPSDVAATWADVSQARQLLNWTPSTPFQDGIDRLMDWYRQNRQWAKEIHCDDP